MKLAVKQSKFVTEDEIKIFISDDIRHKMIHNKLLIEFNSISKKDFLRDIYKHMMDTSSGMFSLRRVSPDVYGSYSQVAAYCELEEDVTALKLYFDGMEEEELKG